MRDEKHFAFLLRHPVFSHLCIVCVADIGNQHNQSGQLVAMSKILDNLKIDNPFQIIKTDWVEYGSSSSKSEARIIAPLWMAWLLVKFNYINMSSRFGRIFSMLAKWSGTWIEIRGK